MLRVFLSIGSLLSRPGRAGGSDIETCRDKQAEPAAG